MNRVRWQALVVLALAVLTYGGALAWRPTAHLADMRPKIDLEALFPRKFAGWALDERTPVQLISPDQAAVLNAIYAQTLSRTYVNAQGQRIMLSVAYGGDQTDATRAHRPEVCYPAQGFQILDSQVSSVSLGEHPLRVKHLLAKLGGRVEPITYWVAVGDQTALSGTEQKLAQLSYTFRGVIPDGMLVRVSSIDGDADAAYRIQARFVADLALAIQSDQRARVVGRAASGG